jgi:hypothetical protein
MQREGDVQLALLPGKTHVLSDQGGELVQADKVCRRHIFQPLHAALATNQCHVEWLLPDLGTLCVSAVDLQV